MAGPRVPGGTGTAPFQEFLQDSLNRQVVAPHASPLITPEALLTGTQAFRNLISNGDFRSWSAGTTSFPDGWSTTSGETVAQDVTNVQYGRIGMQVTSLLNVGTNVQQKPIATISATVNTIWRSRVITMSAWCKCSVATRARLQMNFGAGDVFSGYHSGSGSYELLTLTATVDAAATFIQVLVRIDSGSAIAVTWSGVCLVDGAAPTAWSADPKDGWLVPRTAINNVVTTTTSTTAVDLTGASIANIVLDGTQSLLLLFNGQVSGDTVSVALTDMNIIGAATNTPAISWGVDVVNTRHIHSIMLLDRKPAAGTYTVKVQWLTTAGATAKIQNYTLIALVIPDL